MGPVMPSPQAIATGLLLLKELGTLLKDVSLKIPKIAGAVMRELSDEQKRGRLPAQEQSAGQEAKRALDVLGDEVKALREQVGEMYTQLETTTTQSAQWQQETIIYLLDQNAQVIRALIEKVALIDQQLFTLLAPTPRQAVPADDLARARPPVVSRLIGDARKQVKDAFEPLQPAFKQAAKLAATLTSEPSCEPLPPLPTEDPLDVLARDVRWKMTAASHLRSHATGLRFEDWYILVYTFDRYVINYIAVSGTDSATAHVCYLRRKPECMPRTEDEWHNVLEEGAKRFGEFTALPGRGLNDLAQRLANAWQMHGS